MNDIRDLHHRAMARAEAAELAKLRGEDQNLAALLEQAFELEKQAAGLCAPDLTLEPTRSVLHRSAAALALRCKQFRDAERLIAVGLSGNPPDEIADELRDLLEQVSFERHLALRGLSLYPEEIQLALVGRVVGFGMALTEEFVGRIQAFERLVYRTAERKLGIGYRERGAPDKALRDRIEVFVSVPRAASFAVSLRLGKPSEQPTFGFPETLSASEIVDDVVNGLDKLNAGNLEAVRASIPDEAYYRNFVGLARKIAPDGADIRLVGLTLVRNSERRELALTRTASGIARVQKPEPDAVHVAIQGFLKYADDTAEGKGTIKLVDNQGKAHPIMVPDGMMSDIVRPLWDYLVVVEGTQVGSVIRLDDIRRAEE